MMLTETLVNEKILRRVKARELTGSQVVVDMRFSSVPEKGIVWSRLRNQTLLTSSKPYHLHGACIVRVG